MENTYISKFNEARIKKHLSLMLQTMRSKYTGKVGKITLHGICVQIKIQPFLSIADFFIEGIFDDKVKILTKIDDANISDPDVVELIMKTLNTIFICKNCQAYTSEPEYVSFNMCSACTIASLFKTPDDDCSICMEALSERPCAKLVCGHYIHDMCLNKYQLFAHQKDDDAICKCPLCRKDLVVCEEI